MQAGAKKLWKDCVWPDMVAKHQQSMTGRRRSRIVPSVNAEFATKFGNALKDTFGADGGKLIGMTGR